MVLFDLTDFYYDCFIKILSFSGTTSVVLNEVKVPSMVQNATKSHIILDCIYSLNHSEKDGMILKWYFNGKAIFQWIPPSKPKVDTQYRLRNLDWFLSFLKKSLNKARSIELYLINLLNKNS